MSAKRCSRQYKNIYEDHKDENIYEDHKDENIYEDHKDENIYVPWYQKPFINETGKKNMNNSRSCTARSMPLTPTMMSFFSQWS